MKLSTTSWYIRVWYSKVEQNRNCWGLLICGLQNFDLVLEMNKVLEFVSPDIPRWNVLMEHKSKCIGSPTHVCNLVSNQQTKVGKKLKNRNVLSRNLRSQWMHRVLLFCKTHAKKIGIAESRTKMWDSWWSLLSLFVSKAKPLAIEAKVT